MIAMPEVQMSNCAIGASRHISRRRCGGAGCAFLPNFAFHRVGDSSTVEQRTLLYSGGGGQALSG
jgi:hypothetical protein